MPTPRLDIAIVGAGIAGLSAAWLLSRNHRVTLFERANWIGGHANPVDVRSERGTIPVDTGFIVYNNRNYPNLAALFRHLDVATETSDMSFAISLHGGRLEYSNDLPSGLFAQPGNVLRLRFWSMLCDLRRFYAAAGADLAVGEALGGAARPWATPDASGRILPSAAAPNEFGRAA